MGMIVPISNQPSPARTDSSALPAPDPTFVMMAAAQMHSEGRLIKPAADRETDSLGQSGPVSQYNADTDFGHDKMPFEDWMKQGSGGKRPNDVPDNVPSITSYGEHAKIDEVINSTSTFHIPNSKFTGGTADKWFTEEDAKKFGVNRKVLSDKSVLIHKLDDKTS